MGAAGLVEGVACILSIVNGIVPPTINYEVPDPECDIDCAPNVARIMPVPMAMSNSMGLGGHNSCVIFRAFDEN